MGKIALAVISNDWHLKENNLEEITTLVRQKCELAISLNAGHLFVLGDIFDSRIAQKQIVLSAFSNILDIVSSYELKMVIIPGNHDKTDYSSKESFLLPFKDHPALLLISLTGGIPFKNHNIYVHFVPFFNEEIWLGVYGDLLNYASDEFDEDSVKQILCTHIAVTGSKNNDGSMVTSKLSTKIFKDFFKVFSGHYHDQQKIGENFYHLPSIRQNNFGEDLDKGFTILYSDGSHELRKSNFKKFIKVTVDIDTDKEKLLSLTNKYKGSDDNVRFEIIGSENALKALRKEDITSCGIGIVTKIKEIQDDILFVENEEIKEYNASTIKDAFAEFCEKENLSNEEGLKFLIQVLKNESN